MVGVLGLMGLAACKNDPTTLLLSVVNQTSAPVPDEVQLRVFDLEGVVYESMSLSVSAGAPTSGELGTVVIYGKGALALRIVAIGLKRGQSTPLSEGVVLTTLVANKQAHATVILTAGLLSDGDRDGVPDLADNCPGIRNPKQERCATDAGVGRDAPDGSLAVDMAQAMDVVDAPATMDGAADGNRNGANGEAGANAGGSDGPGDDGGPPGKANGAACMVGTECASAVCVEGVCCDVACAGPCRSCVLTGSIGTCSKRPSTTRCAPTVCLGASTEMVFMCGANAACSFTATRSCTTGSMCVAPDGCK
jgi:hypothetical protein